VTFALAVLAASVVGSVHCAAMCGAFACFYAAGPSRGRGEEGRAHLTYNAGRLVAYLALGAAAGVVGAGIERAGALAGVQQGAAIVAGLLMIAWAVHALLGAGGVRVAGPAVPGAWRRAMGQAVARVRTSPPVTRAWVTGLATALLPCGWLWAFVVTAAGTGSPARAALTMAVFWTGTLPMMIAVGAGARRLTGRWGARLPVASAAAVLVLGVLSVGGRLGLPGTRWVHRLLPAVPVAEGAPVAHAVPGHPTADHAAHGGH
jgi:sulfite exporter TauE/SafE